MTSALIRVLLVDDEPLALENVFEMVEWEANGFVVIGQATSGRKALQLYEQFRPHIVIADISMSPMSGLELGAVIQQSNPETKLLFLTAYRNFDYARQALELRAASYMLKHEISNDRLLAQLLELKLLIEAEGKEKNDKLRLMIGNLLAGADSASEGQLITMARTYLRQQSVVLYWEIDCKVGLDGSRHCERLSGEVLRIIEKNVVGQVEQVEEILILEYGSGYIALIKLKLPNSQLIVHYGMQTVSVHIQRLLLPYADAKPFLMMAALTGNEPEGCCPAMQQAYDYGLLLSAGSTFTLEQALHAATSLKNKKVFPTWQELCEGESANVEKLGTRLQSMLDEQNLAEFRELLIQLPSWSKELDVPTSQSTYASAAELVHQLLALLAARLADSRKKSQYSRWVRKAMEDVQLHYADPDLSLDVIAGRLQISSVHLRTTFKRETGQSLLDFTTEYRIGVAKKMLLEGDRKVYEIAELVGYKTAQYFSQVFKRLTGVQPKDYNGQTVGGERDADHS